jgi:predicted permease
VRVIASIRRLMAKLVNVVRSDRAERELAREIEAHLALLEEEYRRRGLAPGEARRAAKASLGGVTQTRELHRDTRGFLWVGEVKRDMSYAARTLRRTPIVAATAVLSLAIGIGANTAVFTVANTLLFRGPLGVADADRLVEIGTARDGGGFNPTSFPVYVDVRDRATTLAGVYASPMFPHEVSVAFGGNVPNAERIFNQVVTVNYFSVLGVRPSVGRLFDATDSEAPGASPIAVLSHQFWMSRFHGDPGVVGTTARINHYPLTIVGVASEGFHGTGLTVPDVWTPMNMLGALTGQSDPISTSREGGWIVVGARLKPGVPFAAAMTEIDVLARDLARTYPGAVTAKGLRMLPSSSVSGNRTTVAVLAGLLMAMVSLVLLVACANVSGILIARASARQREMAVRLSLGASRSRLIRQLLTETLVIFLIGGTFGFVLARVLTSLLVDSLSALPFPISMSFALDARVVAFTVGVSLLTAVASGLVPAIRTSKAEPVAALKDESQGPSSRAKMRSVFVVAQVALSVSLVIAAGLFARALTRAAGHDPGFDPRGVELISLHLQAGGHRGARLAFWHGLLERVREVPGVQHATIARVLPGGFEGIGLSVGVPGVPTEDDYFPGNVVEPGYFETLRIPIVAGRDFKVTDRSGAMLVAIVGEGVARHFWPGQDALGKMLTERIAGGTRSYIVVGVARDITSSSLIDGMARSFIYLPLQQQSTDIFTSPMTIATRTIDGRSVASAIGKLVSSMDPGLPPATSSTLEESVALGLVPQRIVATLSGSLGMAGLLLAAIGIYGVTAFTVSRRLREFGIRVALGARPVDILSIVLRQGLGMTLSGCAIGVLLGAGAAQVLAGFLLGVPALDFVTFASAVVLSATVGLAACYGPARRATGVNPLAVLRCD